MTDLEQLARKFGLPLDGSAIVCGQARVTAGDGCLFVSTCHEPTAAALWVENFGETLFRQKANGYLTLRITERQLWRVIEAIEEGYRS